MRGPRQSFECKRALEMYDGGTPVYAAAEKMGLSPSTIYKALKSRKKKKGKKRG